MFSVQLLEADVVGVLPEALTAHVQVVLANQAVPKKTGKLETFKTKISSYLLEQALQHLDPWPYFRGRLYQMLS